MSKTTKHLLVYLGLATLGIGAIIPSCKTRNSKGKDDSLLSSSDSGDDKAKQEKIDQDIKSFDETQKKLLEANQQGKSGCEKLDILWNKINETKQAENETMAPNGKPKEIIAFGNGSANRFWRIFEGWGKNEGGSEIRPYENGTTNFVRLTHRYSVLAKLKYVVNKEAVTKLGYTGQYAEGNDCVLGRFSSAVPTSVTERFTPAVATKFFLGGDSESQVLIAQHDIGGQSSGTDYTVNPPKQKVVDNNFYTHYLSNRLSFEKGVLSGVGAFSRFFYTVQYFAVKKGGFTNKEIADPRELMASHLANKSVSGAAVSNPKGPRFIWMVAPSAAMKSRFGEMASADLDFRKHFFALNQDMAGGSKSISIFKVYASDEWTYTPETDATMIGELVTNSNFVASEAADVRLFFKHSIQFRKIPDETKPNPYYQDFPTTEWGDKLFTSNCALGVRQPEVIPSSATDLDGTFIRDAVLNPATLRKNDKGEICIKNIVESKLEATLAPYLLKL
ncbi:MAG: hypothetical protein NTX25_05015 [Proteobacteria bacterium]|nr:hypothetical protein [Pseudomonadota bacterium]